jgi:hypothetical protein
MGETDTIDAVGLLTAKEVQTWRNDLKHIYPVPEDTKFEDLLRAIDQTKSRRMR